MMSEDILVGIPCLFKAACDLDKTGKKWAVFLEPAVLIQAAGRMKDEGFFLEDITGLDTEDGLVALYHFDHYSGSGRVAFYVVISHTEAKLPSISDIYTGAGWHERECHDFFGIRFTDHPNLDPLLLPDDLTIHPLLKDEGLRVPLKDFLDPEKIVTKDARFTLLDKTGATVEKAPTPNHGKGDK